MSTDSSAEQAQNLKDVLGFDPNSTAANQKGVRTPGGSEISRVSKGTGIEEDAIRFRFDRDFIVGGEIIHSDPDKLFNITMYNGDTRRVYKKINPHYSSVDNGGTLILKVANKDEELDREIIVHRDSDDPNEAGISRGQSLVFEKDKFEVKGGTGNRTFDARYDKSGVLERVLSSAQVFSNDEHDDFRGDSLSVMCGVADFQFEEQVWAQDSATPWQWEPNEKEQELKMWRGDREDPVDELIVPWRVDISALRADLFPDYLLKNPQDSNLELDRSWKDVDLFKKVGVSFSSFKNDSINTLPEPKWVEDLKGPQK